MRFDTVIFDLDGTLLDTLEDLKNSTNFALARNGYPERSIDEVRRFVGNGIRNLIERAVPEGTSASEVDKVFESFRSHYADNCRVSTKPYAGIIDMIDKFHERGIKMGIVSNKVDFAVKELSAFYFGDKIPVAIGECENVRRKPEPDTVNKAIKELSSDKKHTVYVGDSDVDIMTAKNAGLECISVLWGFRDKQFLEEHGGKIFVNSPKQIEEIVLG